MAEKQVSRGGNAGQPAAAESLERYLAPLHAYIARRVRLLEASGAVWPGSLSVPSLVNQTVVAALQQWASRPTEMPPLRWLRHLARDVIERAVARVQEAEQREVSLATPVARRLRPQPWEPRTQLHLADVLPNPEAPPPAEAIENREVQDYFCCTLGQLPEAWREPLLLRVVDGYSVEEIAKLEGTSVAEVKRDLARAREWIRAKLAEEYGEAPPRRAWETLVREAEEVPPPELSYATVLKSLERAQEATQGLPSSQGHGAARRAG